MAKDFNIFVKSAKFRQIWSHCKWEWTKLLWTVSEVSSQSWAFRLASSQESVMNTAALYCGILASTHQLGIQILQIFRKYPAEGKLTAFIILATAWRSELRKQLTLKSKVLLS